MEGFVYLWCCVIWLAIALIGAFFGGVLLLLIKLGVIAHYAAKEEPEEVGEYSIEQSREV